MLLRGSDTNSLRPPRETRYTPDETSVLEILDQDLVISLPDAKNSLKVFHNSNDDAFIQNKIKAATAQVEKYVRIDVRQKKRKSVWYKVPAIAHLMSYPTRDILKVSVIDEHGSESVLQQGVDYFVQGVDTKSLYRFNRSFGESGELHIEYVTGYTKQERNDGIVPEIIGAIEQEVSLQYKNRQDPDTPAMTSVNNLSLEARHLLTPIIRRAF